MSTFEFIYFLIHVCIDAFCWGVDLAKWWPKTSFLLKTSRSFCSTIAPRCLFEGGEFTMKVCSQILDEPLLCRRETKDTKRKKGKSIQLAKGNGERRNRTISRVCRPLDGHMVLPGTTLEKWEWLPTVLGNSNLNKIFWQGLTVSTIIWSSKMNVVRVIKQSSEVFRSF